LPAVVSFTAAGQIEESLLPPYTTRREVRGSQKGVEGAENVKKQGAEDVKEGLWRVVEVTGGCLVPISGPDGGVER